jgi:hypothetical protein
MTFNTPLPTFTARVIVGNVNPSTDGEVGKKNSIKRTAIFIKAAPRVGENPF